ncbi:MAG: DNA recombination protein RmuC [Gammaproteobacteria bacterium WSBS_2016_MAG_OTU1]
MNVFMVIFLILLLAVIAVLVVVWSRATKKTSQLEAELTNEKTRVTELNNAQNELNNKYEKAQEEKASAEIEKAEVVARTDNEQQNIAKLREDNNALNEQTKKDAAQISQLETELKNERIKAEEKVAMLENMRENMEIQFKNLSQSILDEKSKTFDDNSKKLLEPFGEKLHEFRQRVDKIHSDDTQQRASLQQQIESLQKNAVTVGHEANNLVLALKGNSKTQGNWGEIALARLLEESGLREGEEYRTQPIVRDEAGSAKRPDVVIDLPEKKHLIIDSKVSLLDYHAATITEDPNEQKDALARHVASCKKHVNDLSGKHYAQSSDVNAPDFVFMFMPIEPAFFAALRESPDLFLYAYNKKIILCAPTTIMATLRTVAHIWRMDKQNRNTDEIVRQCSNLYDKFVGFVENMNDIDKAIRKADEACKSARGQLETGRDNLIGKVEKLRTLGANPKKQLPNLSEEDN